MRLGKSTFLRIIKNYFKKKLQRFSKIFEKRKNRFYLLVNIKKITCKLPNCFLGLWRFTGIDIPTFQIVHFFKNIVSKTNFKTNILFCKAYWSLISVWYIIFISIFTDGNSKSKSTYILILLIRVWWQYHIIQLLLLNNRHNEQLINECIKIWN